MKKTEIHWCLDCDYAGPLVCVGGTSQCPNCASRAVWPVSAWVAPPALRALPFHRPAASRAPGHDPGGRREFRLLRTVGVDGRYCYEPVGGCCDMVPTFFGGSQR